MLSRLLAEVLPALAMLPEEEPEQQLTMVTESQIAEHLAAKKAAANKAGGTACGLSGFAATGTKATVAGKAGAADATRKAAAGNAAPAAKAMTAITSASDAHLRSKASSEPADAAVPPSPALTHAELRQLHVERQQLTSEPLGHCRHRHPSNSSDPTPWDVLWKSDRALVVEHTCKRTAQGPSSLIAALGHL